MSLRTTHANFIAVKGQTYIQMKNTFLIIALFTASISIAACNNQEKKDSHSHDDGSTHDDHAQDTTSVKQEEFKVDSAQADTAGEHSHDNEEKHSH